MHTEPHRVLHSNYPILHEVIILKTALPSMYPGGVIRKYFWKTFSGCVHRESCRAGSWTLYLSWRWIALFTGSTSNRAATSLHKSRVQKQKNEKIKTAHFFLKTLSTRHTFLSGGEEGGEGSFKQTQEQQRKEFHSVHFTEYLYPGS